MRIFVLDDDLKRIEKFKTSLAGHDLTVGSRVADVALFKPPYDAIFLDHDLTPLLDDAENGFEFAKLIAPRVNDHCMIITHSWNPKGAANIVRVFYPRGQWCAFGTMAFNYLLKGMGK